MTLYSSIEEVKAAVDLLVRDRLGKREKFPTEEEMRSQYRELFEALASNMDLPQHLVDEAVEELIHTFLTELEVTKAVGTALVDKETKSWLEDASNKIEKQLGWFYWDRYEDYLRNELRWNEASVRSLTKDTWNILNLMADPLGSESFDRRGLVVASVQSGKTANYIGLITRAADAGYKIIIVLAGIHNVLRNQTQKRIEEGFSGFDISSTTLTAVGVGKRRFKPTAKRVPHMFTSRDRDFSKERAYALRAIQNTDSDEPFVFVIKKNANSLKQVYEWVKETAKRTDSILLIDDEADNASINVRYKKERNEEDNPTRINSQIRKILLFFNKRCYVGYTATPFANILIDPNADDEEHGSDLFPRSFIYTLEEASDYFGAQKVFEDFEDPSPKHLRRLQDISDVLPPKHKSDAELVSLPWSLEEAVRTFILATVIRGIRGDETKHSTMMVNVSPYNQPQKSIEFLLHNFVGGLREDVRAYASLGDEAARRSSPKIQALYQTWAKEYSHLEEAPWKDVFSHLPRIVSKVSTVLVNSSSNDILDYGSEAKYVIAVGGYRLSRGLTLEGLVVSYYSRNARAYDALMQMARWFGYRPRFEDLVRVWMSEESAGWYSFVANATGELMQEFRTMHQMKRTPKDFGLKIRQSPDSLIITARNKLGTGEVIPISIDPSGKLIETTALSRVPSVIAQNKATILRLLERIVDSRDSSSKGLLFRDVESEFVLDFLSDFINDDIYSPNSQSSLMTDYINRRLADDELIKWDVYVAQGTVDAREIAPGITLCFEQRYPGDRTTADSVVIGSKNRLSSRGIDRVGLTAEQIDEAETSFYETNDREKSVPDYIFRTKREKPLLVLHPLLLAYSEKQIDERRNSDRDRLTIGTWPSLKYSEENYGWSVSFPKSIYPTTAVRYVLNSTAMRELFGSFEDEDDDIYEF